MTKAKDDVKTPKTKAPKASKSPKKAKKAAVKDAAARAKPGPRPKPKGELSRNCVAIHVTDAQKKGLKEYAAKNELKSPGKAAHRIVTKYLATQGVV